jgi:hypothetical protein
MSVGKMTVDEMSAFDVSVDKITVEMALNKMAR